MGFILRKLHKTTTTQQRPAVLMEYKIQGDRRQNASYKYTHMMMLLFTVQS